MQPTQTRTQAEDYGQLIYPEWWPKESGRPPTAPCPKRVTKPKPKPAKAATFVEPQKDPRPIMKTTGTSTTLVQPPFRMNYTPRLPAKTVKTVGFTQPKPVSSPFPPEAEDRPQSDLLDISEDMGATPGAGSSLSNSSKEPRLKWSLPEDEREEDRERSAEAKTVKRQQFTKWTGDFSNVVKRSPLQSSAEFTSQSSEQRLKESSSGSRREATPTGDASRHFETSSTSSISTYHPSEELKAFYRNEHEKIFAEPQKKRGLKTLETREIPLEPGHVSMSAQLYRTGGSSDVSEGERYHDDGLGSMESFSRS